MAKLHNGSASNPTTAPKGPNAKHVNGMKGPPYSVCASAGANLQHASA